MSASERFTQLTQKVETADGNIQAAASEDRAKLAVRADEARKAADDHAAQLRAKAEDTSDKAEAHWNEIQSNWDPHIQRIRQRIEDKKTEHDVDSAERDAEWAEADALDGGDSVLAVAREHGRGSRSGATVSARIFIVVTFRSGKVLRYREFYDEAAALEAAGLRD